MVRINLLPIRQILRKRELKQAGMIAGIAVAVVLGVMGASYAALTWTVSSLESEKKQRQTKLNELKKKNKEIDRLKREITRLQKQVETIQKLTKTRDTPAPFMAAVSSAIPGEVWLTAINKTGRQFRLAGTGVDNTVVVNFVQRLQRLRQEFSPERPWVDAASPDDKTFFRNVKLLSIVRKGGAGLGTMDFTITGMLR
jgi:type IV pilus assembly protein PilN